MSYVTQGTNVNVRTNNGRTALMVAAEGGNLEIVKYLVEHDAYVNAEAIEIAADHHHLEVEKYLKEHLKSTIKHFHHFIIQCSTKCNI